MKASSLFFVGITVALVSIAPANAQKAEDTQTTKNPIVYRKHEKHSLRQVTDQASGQIYCNRSVPCRPVKKGCHLEHEWAGFNEEICN